MRALDRPEGAARDDATVKVHPGVDRAAAYAWRVLVIAGVIAGGIWLVGQVLVVVIPVIVALLFARALAPVATWLRRRGVPASIAALLTVVASLAVVLGALVASGASVAAQFGDLGATVSQGISDIEAWLVEDGPFDVARDDVEQWRERAEDALSQFVRSSDGSVVSGAVLVLEIAVGALLALVLTFFFLRDGRSIREAALRAVPLDRRDRVVRATRRGWDAIGGYLRGAVMLGAVESVAIGLTLLLVGSSLVAPVMVVTFLAAFVPIVGAVVAGIIAVLVALVTAGGSAAVIVAVVAVAVQQLDNDVLAPLIYGRALRLHPLVILLGIAAGGALFGFVGTFLAVPVLAVALNVLDEWRG